MLRFVRRLLTGSGRLPDRARATLEAERLVLLEEELPGSVTYKRYGAPGKRYGWRRSSTTAAVALTRRRVVVHQRGDAVLDVVYDHPSIDALHVRAEPPDRLLISYEASAFHLDRSGRVEVHLRTARAADIAAELERRVEPVAV